MINRAITMALAAASAVLAQPQSITGDWMGTLKVGGAEMRLVLHIGKDGAGALKASMDSIDQGANGIAVDSISLAGSKLTFSSGAVHGTYEGKVNSSATVIAGTWSQGQPLRLDFQRMAASTKTQHKPAAPSDVDGAWVGALDVKVAKLRLVVRFTNTADGLTATMDSPDQGARGLPVTTVTRNGRSLVFEMKQLGGRFEGKFSEDLATLDGTWTQGANSWPLSLQRVKDATKVERPRPQTPVRPYPYREEEVSYENKAAGIRLAGTLTIPRGNGPFPAVVLITGSGPQDRDETLLGHHPFLILADYLTRKGIVVLRADDRGFGKSGGDFAAAITPDFASDTEAGIAYLTTRPEADAHRIGLIGHSEGGIVAPMVAVADPRVAFIVMMAGPAVPLAQILVAQQRLILQAGGMSEKELDEKAARQNAVLTLVKQEKDNAVFEKKMKEQLAGVVSDDQIGMQAKMIGSPWFRWLLEYDPAVTLRKLKCPVLAINGEKDLQVPPRQNLPPIRAALKEGGNSDYEVDELAGLNHLFQTAKSGAPSEYAEIEETMSPAALEKMAAWILKH